MIRIKVNAAALKAAIRRVHQIAPSKPALESLCDVRIVAGAGKLTLSCTNLTTTVQREIPAIIISPGVETVDARRFNKVIQASVCDEFEIWREGEKLHIKGGRSKFRLASTPADMFPTIPALRGVDRIPVDGEQLRSALERTAPSMSTDASRPMLCGVYVHQPAGQTLVRFVATDGHRLVSCERQIISNQAKELDGLLISRDVIPEFLKSVDKGAELAVSENMIALFVGGETVLGRLLDHHYPDYRQVIPRSFENHIMVDRKKLISALKRMRLMPEESTDKKIKTDRLIMSARPGQIDIKVHGNEHGDAQETMEAEYEGPSMDVAFGLRYGLDALSSISSDEVRININNPLAPITLEDQDHRADIFIVMPMRC